MKYGRSFAHVAGFLYRGEDEVREMAEALGLKEALGIGEVPPAVPDVLGL